MPNMNLRSPPGAEAPADVVLTHHWLVRHRGGEKVLEALRELCPEAPIYTLLHDPIGTDGRWSGVRASWIDRLPGARRHYPRLLALLALAASRTQLPPARVVLCSDASVAKAMRPAPGSKLICYCHSPMRYVWDERLRAEYVRSIPALLRPAFHASAAIARHVDAAGARRVDVFVANSNFIAERIRRCYGRESRVVYPPVELPTAPSARPRGDFYLFVGHNAPYKRLDLARAACSALGRRLVVIGDGFRPADASDRAEYLGYQRDAAVSEYYERARGLLFPGVEDFGLVPVEAMARGCPVIALGEGGACETVLDGQTGVLFGQASTECLVRAIRTAETMQFCPRTMWSAMQRFGKARFLAEMTRIIEEARSGMGAPTPD